jgi:holo-[acyl-carrier protein] synthase
MIQTGIDLVEVGRIEQAIAHHGARFLDRIFTQAEQSTCAGNVTRLAGRFAVKEAVAKALGTGIGDVEWTEIEVVTDEIGRPHLDLHGNAARLAQHLTFSISISHTETHAIGLAVALSKSCVIS